MSEQFLFGECLGVFLSELNVSRSRLAKEINVDRSLVSRWISGERIPSYDASYLEDISRFLSLCFKTEKRI